MPATTAFFASGPALAPPPPPFLSSSPPCELPLARRGALVQEILERALGRLLGSAMSGGRRRAGLLVLGHALLLGFESLSRIARTCPRRRLSPLLPCGGDRTCPRLAFAALPSDLASAPSRGGSLSSGIVLGFLSPAGGFAAAAGGAGAGAGTCTTTHRARAATSAVITFHASKPMPPTKTDQHDDDQVDPLRRAAGRRQRQQHGRRGENEPNAGKSSAELPLLEPSRRDARHAVLAAIARMSIRPEPSGRGAPASPAKPRGFALGIASDCRLESENSTEFSCRWPVRFSTRPPSWPAMRAAAIAATTASATRAEAGEAEAEPNESPPAAARRRRGAANTSRPRRRRRRTGTVSRPSDGGRALRRVPLVGCRRRRGEHVARWDRPLSAGDERRRTRAPRRASASRRSLLSRCRCRRLISPRSMRAADVSLRNRADLLAVDDDVPAAFCGWLARQPLRRLASRRRAPR